MKKIVSGILLAGTILSMIACKNTSEKPDSEIAKPDIAVSDTEDIKDEAYYTSDLSNERYDGYTYRILVRKGYKEDYYFDEPQDDLIYDAIYRRNAAVEERFGIKIQCDESSEDNTDTSALNSILAGDDAYDLIITHTRSAFAYANQGACYNVNDISSIHTDKPWWTKDLVDSCNINGKLYVLAGDYSLGALRQSMCMYFNKRIFDELGYDYPYEMVLDGEWTFDELAYLAKKGSADLNGDGVLTPEADQFGFIAQEYYSPVAILYAGGQRICKKNDEGLAELSYYSNKTVDIFEEFYSLMNSEACYIQYVNAPHYVDFADGKTMFIDGMLGAASSYRSMDDDFGILPYPKFDTEDEYHTTYNAVADMGLIPITVEDVERTGAITEALCAYGSMYVVPAFYDVALKTKSARDGESEAMMDIIRDGLVYDVAYLSGFGNLGGRAFLRDTFPNVASDYKSKESAAREAVAAFNKNYGGYDG